MRAAGFWWRAVVALALLLALVAAAESYGAGGNEGRLWLWKVSAPGGIVYIAGCLHATDARREMTYAGYLPYLRNAAALYLEVAPHAWQSYDCRKLMEMHGLLHDGVRLRDRVSLECWGAVQGRLKEDPALLETVAGMQPWLAAFTLTHRGYTKAGLDRSNGLESYLETEAISESKPIGGLESARDQILALASAPASEQEQLLREAVANLNGASSSTKELRDAWDAGDQTRLEGALCRSAATTPELHKALVEERNERWVKKILAIADRNHPPLVVVGVEHLTTAHRSLPTLLKEHGCEAARVSN